MNFQKRINGIVLRPPSATHYAVFTFVLLFTISTLSFPLKTYAGPIDWSAKIFEFAKNLAEAGKRIGEIREGEIKPEVEQQLKDTGRWDDLQVFLEEFPDERVKKGLRGYYVFQNEISNPDSLFIKELVGSGVDVVVGSYKNPSLGLSSNLPPSLEEAAKLPLKARIAPGIKDMVGAIKTLFGIDGDKKEETAAKRQKQENQKKIEEQRRAQIAAEEAKQREQQANTVSCNDKLWSKCPEGQTFYCPPIGDAQCRNIAAEQEAQKHQQQEEQRLAEEKRKAQAGAEEAKRKEQQANLISCNGKNWSKCPGGQTFYCPSTGDPQCRKITTEKPNIDISQLENQIHTLINAERQKQSLSALDWDGRLADIARNHSQDMAVKNYFNHTNPDGCDTSCRYKQVNYSFSTLAENIGRLSIYKSTYSDGTVAEYNTQAEIAASAVQGWMNSSGHRKNILSPNFSNEGIGVAMGNNGAVFVTENFSMPNEQAVDSVIPSSSQETPQPSTPPVVTAKHSVVVTLADRSGNPLSRDIYGNLVLDGEPDGKVALTVGSIRVMSYKPGAIYAHIVVKDSSGKFLGGLWARADEKHYQGFVTRYSRYGEEELEFRSGNENPPFSCPILPDNVTMGNCYIGGKTYYISRSVIYNSGVIVYSGLNDGKYKLVIESSGNGVYKSREDIDFEVRGADIDLGTIKVDL